MKSQKFVHKLWAWVTIIVLLSGCGQPNNVPGESYDAAEQEEAAVTAADIWDGSVAAGYESGYGTAEDPYIISTAEQFAYFAAQVNSGQTYAGQYFALNADLCLNAPDAINEMEIDENGYLSNYDVNLWTPIGTIDNPFNGYFNGNDHAVSYFVVDAYLFIPRDPYYNQDYYQDYYGVGLFGNVTGNTVIQNIRAEKGIVVVQATSNAVQASPNLDAVEINAGALIGDIITKENGSVVVSCCEVNDCTIVNRIFWEASFSVHIGGMIGRVRRLGAGSVTSHITNCAVYDTSFLLYGNSSIVGGVVGQAQYSDFSQCYCDSLTVSSISSPYDTVSKSS